MATEEKTRLTADEFLCFEGDPDKRYELVDGEVIELSPPPGHEHGGVAFNAGMLVGNFVRPRHLGRLYAAETGFKIHQLPDTIRAADLSFVSRGRLPDGSNPQRYLALAPDFLVEVVSPDDNAQRVEEKVQDWLRAGTQVVWVAYPSLKGVFVWRGLDRVEWRSGDDDIDAEPVLPGFSCKVAELFSED